MKGVILAGGTGTRLRPLTYWTNKHLLPVGRYPMICYGVAKLRQAGIRDIVLVTGRATIGGFADVLGSGRDWGVSLTYRLQEEAGGIAQALDLARSLIGPQEKFVVLLGDNLFEHSLEPYLQAFQRQPDGAMVLLKRVDDPHRYGVAEFDPDTGRIARILEKPEHPPTSYCVTGIYFYSGDVFRIMDRIEPSRRGELEITDVNNAYAAEGRLEHMELDGWWTDAGTFGTLDEAAKKMKGILV